MKAADAAEAEFAADAVPPIGSLASLAAELVDDDLVLPAVSTSGSAFQAILDDLVRTVGDDELAASVASAGARIQAETKGPDTPSRSSADGRTGPLVAAEGARATGAAAARPPALLRGRGDLTLVIGLGADALGAARALAEAIGDAEVRPGGCSRAPAARVDDRRGALRARADGVRRERAVVAAFGMTRGSGEVAELAEALAGIAPDQVWAAVDASRKAEDTAAWVRAVDGVLAVDALVVTGSQLTATPGSVRELGIPIGWLDGAMLGAGPAGTAPVGIG
ncbi:hypothetical protein [Leifsonia sp. NPDC058248]|uniref:hypothetical protein n=1 Tax=Leifsonia sp. NPDC058248 TaxID=3346402 RepID=UPI0036DF98C0